MKISTLLLEFLLICFAYGSFALSKINSHKYNLAVCAIFQQEGPYLKEWIEFHKLMGAQHFYLYNNFSTDNYYDELKSYIKSGEVELVDWPIKAKPGNDQWVLSAYNNALSKAKGKVKWLAYLDLDEYLFPVEKGSIEEFLKDYEKFGGVCANWVMFGTSSIAKIPSGQITLEYLIARAPDNHGENIHVKSIIRPEYVISMPSPHCAQYIPGYFQVNANKEQFDGPFSPYIALDKIRVHHYWTRDEYYLHTIKIPRRFMDMGESAESCINRSQQLNVVEDKAIFKFIPQLKANLKDKRL